MSGIDVTDWGEASLSSDSGTLAPSVCGFFINSRQLPTLPEEEKSVKDQALAGVYWTGPEVIYTSLLSKFHCPVLQGGV